MPVVDNQRAARRMRVARRITGRLGPVCQVDAVALMLFFATGDSAAVAECPILYGERHIAVVEQHLRLPVNQYCCWLQANPLFDADQVFLPAGEMQ